jgi:hypothetical protein
LRQALKWEPSHETLQVALIFGASLGGESLRASEESESPVNLLRRLPLSRLLLLCGLVVVIGIGATALAVGLSTGPVPPPKPLAEAVHDSLAGAGSRSRA